MSSIKSLTKLDNTPATKIQWQTLEFIFHYIQIYGYAPSIPEIAQFFNKSISAIFERVERLKRKGLLEKWKF